MSLSVSKALAPISQDLADVQRQEALRIKDMRELCERPQRVFSLTLK